MIGLRWLVLLSGVLMLIVLILLMPVRPWVSEAIIWVSLLVAASNAIASDLLDRQPPDPSAEQLPAAQRRLNVLVLGQSLVDLGAIGVLIHLTGGMASPVKLLLLVYMATMASILSSRLLMGMLGFVLGGYSTLVVLYLEHWLRPVLVNPLFEASLRSVPRQARWAELIFFDICMALIVVLISSMTREANRLWFRSLRQQRFLEQLHRTTNIGLEHERLDALYEELAVQMQAILACESLWLLRWREDGRRAEPVAVSGRTYGRVWLPPPEVLRTLDSLRLLEDEEFTSRLSGEVLAVPLFERGSHHHRLGVALAVYPEGYRFTEEDKALAAQMADTVTLLISRSELHIETHRRSLLLEQLAHLVTRAERTLNLDAVSRRAVEGVRRLLDAQRAAIYLYYADRDELECLYAEGLSEKYTQYIARSFRSVPGAALMESASLVYVMDVRTDPRTAALRPLMEEEGFRSYAVFMARTDHLLQGALAVYWDRLHRLTEDEEVVGRLYADHVGMLIQNARLYELLEQRSLTDVLTRLPNRRALDQQIAYEVQRSQRAGHSFALLMLDLDGFKKINDTFGHPVGDMVLRQVARALRHVLRATDFIARYGGDEFAVLLPETDLESAFKVAHKLRWAVHRCVLPPPVTGFPLGLSMGMAIYPQHAQDDTALLRLADQALYHVKQNHKGGMAVVGNKQGEFITLMKP